MHYTTSDRGGNQRNFRQSGEQTAERQKGYAGKHPTGAGADM